MKLKVENWKQFLLHLGLIIATGITILVLFFYVYLPYKTNHGESITVPNLEGIVLEDLDEFLTERDLRFEVQADSGFTTEQPPLAVLTQTPKAGSQVKENRKIYVSLNAENPPEVKMPKLIDGSLKNAQMVLQSYGLNLGDITYEAHQFQNAVLEQRYDGKVIEAGSSVPKGSEIDLVVGNGLGNPFPAPSVVSYTREEAEFIIVGSGLQVGSITEREVEDKEPGTIIQQYPAAGESVRTGNTIDLWVTPKNEEEEPSKTLSNINE